MPSYEFIQLKSIPIWLLINWSIQSSYSKQHCIFIQFNQLICTQMNWSTRDIPWLAHDHPTCKLQLNCLQVIKYVQWIINNLNYSTCMLIALGLHSIFTWHWVWMRTRLHILTQHMMINMKSIESSLQCRWYLQSIIHFLMVPKQVWVLSS